MYKLARFDGGRERKSALQTERTRYVAGMEIYRSKSVTQTLERTVQVPGSKSITNRALIAAALADGHSILNGALFAEDTLLMIDALRTLGIAITTDVDGQSVEVSGCGGTISEVAAELWCGNSGTTIRFCAALCALAHGTYTLDGDANMRKRPIGPLVDVLRSMGAGVEYAGEEGFPPVRIHTNGISGGYVSLHDAISSQFASAILLAAPYAHRDVMLEAIGHVVSRPYLHMTTAVMDAFGVTAIEQYETQGARFVVPSGQRYGATVYHVEPDASNASYFLAAPAVCGGRVTISGIGSESIQGDARFASSLEEMGCTVDVQPQSITVRRDSDAGPLRGVEVDLNNMPDMVQTLAVIALFASGPTNIRNVANLRVKETNRLTALQRELTKLGAAVELHHDGLTIHPPQSVQPALIETYSDHRMAMSFAIAGLAVDGIEIADPQCCGKTFPEFFERLEQMCVQES